MSDFKSTGLNYTQEEIAHNGNMVPLGKLHDEVCDYMEKVWKLNDKEILDVSTALWKALEVVQSDLSLAHSIIEKLEKVAEFYGDPDNWMKSWLCNGETVRPQTWRDKLKEEDCAYFNAGGGRARIALAEVKKMKEQI